MTDTAGREGSQFVENDKGVHIWCPLNGEFTLCGDAFDAPDSEDDWDEGPFVETRKRTVTCPDCIAVILACRGLRVKK